MSRHRAKPDAAEDASLKPAPGDDIDTLRRKLAEKLEAFVRQNAWRRCTRPACKRARACRARGADCEGLPTQPELTPEQWQDKLADLKRALKRRMAEFGAGR